STRSGRERLVPERREEPGVVPVVFHALAPLMEALWSPCIVGGLQCPSCLTVGALEAAAPGSGSFGAVEWPLGNAPAGCLHPSADVGKLRSNIRHLHVGSHQSPAERLENPRAELTLEVAYHGVERGQDDVGVAQGSEHPGRIPEVRVLSGIGVA